MVYTFLPLMPSGGPTDETVVRPLQVEYYFHCAGLIMKNNDISNYNPYPQRKRERLDEYDYSRAGSYYVTVCTANRECIFWTGRSSELSAGGNTVTVPIAELSESGRIAEANVKKIHGIDKYVIMPNHIHMIITFATSGDHDLRQEMRNFKSLVSKEIGQSVWERGYFDRIIRGREEYEKYSEYISDNPKKWIIDEFNKNRHAER